MTTGTRARWQLYVLVMVLLGLQIFSEQVTATEIPSLSARVNDYAAMLSPATEQQLESILAALETEDSTQLAVLTINSLGGENLEDFSLKVVEKWQLGQEKLDNGALLLIAKDDRKLRIEVGYGLEGVLTDLTSGRIIRDIITPKFRNGNFDQGVIDGVSAMIAVAKGEFSAKDIVKTGKKVQEDIGGFVIFILFALVYIGRTLGRNKMLAASIGAVIAPGLGGLFFGFQWLILLALIPAGFLATYLASSFLGNISRSIGRGSGGFSRHSSGGFGGGGFGGGGFGGGGGGFGGGGASGGW